MRRNNRRDRDFVVKPAKFTLLVGLPVSILEAVLFYMLIGPLINFCHLTNLPQNMFSDPLSTICNIVAFVLLVGLLTCVNLLIVEKMISKEMQKRGMLKLDKTEKD